MVEAREPLPSRVQGLPELPPEAAAILDQGLAILGLEAVPVTVRRALIDHLRLLAAWNRAINLTAIRDPVAAVRLHLLDSLTAVPLLRARSADAILDLGSGAGFPGLPLAMVVPTRRALLVDSTAKKARFVATAVTALGLDDRVESFAGRAEVLGADRRHRERWPAVVVRAVAGLPELVELGLPLLAPGGVLVAWKRGDIEDELAASRIPLRILGGGRPLVVSVDPRLELADHRLVLIDKVGPSPAGYPRDPAVRKREPL